jgi:SAM-dependent methyltransferase
MFDTYADIFNKRGAAYHKAMQVYPEARDQEFEAMTALLSPQDGDVIADMPSGGGYLRRYFGSNDVQLVAIETTQAFYEQCIEDESTQSKLCNLDSTGLATGSVDAVASMAGLHHVEDREAVFTEINRILKPDGEVCLADVEKGSEIDGFLNTFVDQHNSMGHKGRFIDKEFRHDLISANFNITFDAMLKYTWSFEGIEEMIDYCRLLFGLDQATSQQILDGISSYQGYFVNNGSCRMNWKLRFIKCTKK